MRNSCPLNILKLVNNCTIVVKLVEFAIERVKSLRGKRLTCHIHIVCAALELCKESLAEDGGAEALKEVIEDIRAALLVGLNAEQVLGEKHLVDGRSDLCNHYLIVVVGVILSAIREIGVHSVTKLVSEGVCIVKRVGIVEKNVGVNAENSAGECAGGLALVLVNVDPMLAVSLVKKLLILLAKRKSSLLYKLLCRLEVHLHINTVNDGTVEVVHMKLLKSESLLAKLEVLLHRGKSRVNRVAKAIVYRNRNVAREECRLAGILVASYSREIRVVLYRARIESRKGVDVFFELAEVLLKGLAADSRVSALSVNSEVTVCKSNLLALLVDDRREGHINALEHIEGVSRVSRNVGHHSEHSFLLCRKHMLSCAQDLVNELAEALELIVLKVREDERLVCGKYLGLHKGDVGAERHEEIYCSSLHLLILGIAVVAVLVQGRVEIYLLGLLCRAIDRVKSCGERLCGLAKSAHNTLKRGNSLLSLCISLFPILASCENMRKIPHKFGIHIFSQIRHNVLLKMLQIVYYIYCITYF